MDPYRTQRVADILAVLPADVHCYVNKTTLARLICDDHYGVDATLKLYEHAVYQVHTSKHQLCAADEPLEKKYGRQFNDNVQKQLAKHVVIGREKAISQGRQLAEASAAEAATLAAYADRQADKDADQVLARFPEYVRPLINKDPMIRLLRDHTYTKKRICLIYRYAVLAVCGPNGVPRFHQRETDMRNIAFIFHTKLNEAYTDLAPE